MKHSWTTMTGALCAAALAALAAGCGVAKTDCNDGFDNDGDALIDDSDPGCGLNGNLEAPDPIFPQCSDHMDNDGDALVDSPEDPGCTSPEDDDEFNEPPPAQCADGIDNDGDQRIDYPNDPGCALTLENDEADDCPDGPECPACANGRDDDADGTPDYPGDAGCGFAADTDEFNTMPGVCGPTISVMPMPAEGVVEGDHLGGVPNELTSPDCGGRGGESVYAYTVDAPSSLVVTTNFPETTLDTVVYVRGECRNPDTEEGCNDDDPIKVSTLVIPRIEPGSYYIVVDAFGPGSIGHFKVSVKTYVAEGEPCDPDVEEVCAPGMVCRKLLPDAATETCEKPECDDGLDNDGDTLVDTPDDPGCGNKADNVEADDCPDGVMCPECGNEVDDDGDTLIDYPEDPGCMQAADNVELDECVPGVEVLEIPGGMATGTTVGGSMMFSASCDSDSSMSPEMIHGYRVNVPLVRLRFSTAGSAFANTLYVRQGVCSVGPDVACAPNTTSSMAQSVTIESPTVGTNYFVFVDGDWSTSGPYVLSAFAELPSGAACTPGDMHITCTSGYTCSPASMTCVPSLCNNDADDDGDGLSDYPDDPGCADLSDDLEGDSCPAGADCPECGNDTDDDADARIDYPDDPGCVAASDGSEIDECIPGVEVLDLPLSGASGTTAGFGSFRGTCNTSTSSGENVYAFRLSRTLASLSFSTVGSAMDTVTYVRFGMCDSMTAEVACADPGPGGEVATVTAPDLGTYFVFVDGDFISSGDYVLAVSGTIALGEACDPAVTQFLCESGSTCDGGTMRCVATSCNNDLDDDGDLKADELDPGCESVDDTTESPDPVPLPQCGNGMDDDADLLTDYPDDLGCSRASDNLELDCDDSDPVTNLILPTVTGTTSGMTDDFVPSCSPGSTAPEVVYSLQVPGSLTSLHMDTNGSVYDTVLHVKRDGCEVSDLGCDDDGGDGLQSLIDLATVAAGTYFIFVDGFGGGAGAYTLHVNGVIANNQTCNPAQVTAGLLVCAAGKSCTDMGTGFKCQ